MAAVTTFKFGKYTLRPAGKQVADLALAKEWTARDPEHRNTTPPAFWMRQEQYTDSYLLLDNIGPVFFFQITQDLAEKTARLSIQFLPITGRWEALRVMTGLRDGLTWLERILTGRGIERIYFDSENEKLIRFCVSRLRFQLRANGILSKQLG